MPSCHRLRPVLLVLTALMVGLLAGCNLVAAAYFVAKGPPKVPSVYELQPERSTVVYLDDRANRLPRRNLRQSITGQIEKTLLENEAVIDVIASRGAMIATSSESFDEPMSLVEIGQAVGAEVLIWITVDTYTLTPDQVSFVPTARIRVKVIDVVTGDRLWPAPGQPLTPIVFSMKQQQGTVPTTRGEMLKAYEQLAVYSGIGIAQMFFEHDTMTSNR